MEALDLQEDCKHSNKDKQMSIGRKKFNMDPKKGNNYNYSMVPTKFISMFSRVFITRQRKEKKNNSQHQKHRTKTEYHSEEKLVQVKFLLF